MPLAWTPQDEQRFQALGSTLGLLQPPTPVAPQGLLGYAGEQAANIAPAALEHLIQPAQTLLSGGTAPESAGEIPRFFNSAPPQGVAQHIVAGAADLASYLPAIIAPEAAGVEGLEALGLGARVSKIGGAALGWAYPSAPEGPQNAAIQGGVGALQTAAQDWGWRGKIAAGIGAGALGYYQGSQQSPEQGMMMAGLNALGPTVIDPLVNKLTRYKPAQDIGGGRPIEGQPAPTQSTMDMMTPEQRAAHIQAITNPQGMGQENAGLPFGTQGQFRNPSTPDAIFGAQPPASGTNWTGQIGLPIGHEEAATGYGSGTNPYDVFAGLQSGQSMGPHWEPPQANIFDPRMQVSERTGLSPDIYGGQTLAPDIFAGLQRVSDVAQPQPIFSPAEAALRAEMLKAKAEVPNSPIDVGPQHPPTQEGPHVISTAVKHDGQIYTGDQPFEAHDAIGVQRNLTDGTAGSSIPEKERGFVVQNKDGSQSFASRKRAADMAFNANQIPNKVDILKSEDLRPMEQAPTGQVPEEVKPGDSVIHWNSQGMPLDVKVNGVEDGIVKYTEHDFTTGAANDKVATLQEFNKLQKHPSERGEAITPPPEPSPNPQQPVGPASGQAASGEKITKAAIKDSNTGKIWTGRFHAEIIEKINEENGVAKNKQLLFKPEEIEFITNKGRYITADEANNFNPKIKGEPTAENFETIKQLSVEKVRIAGKYGWEDATVLGRDGDTLHVEVEDPIFGNRKADVKASDTKPIVETPTEIPNKGVPFKDVESIKLTKKDQIKGIAQKGEGEAELLGTMHEGSGPSKINKTLGGRGTDTLSLEEGLAKLPKEAADVIGTVIARLQEASGQKIATSLAQKMVAAKGGMYEMSGRVALNLQWINGVVQNWTKMSEEARGNAVMRIAATFGHEITHVAQKYGERSGLQINGQPLIQAVMKHVDSLNASQREYIATQIKAAKGDMSAASIKYLAGDIDAVYGWYKRLRPNLTREGAKELAAGELMAEVGSTELAKRMNVEGLPSGFRAAVDKFKQVLINVVNWFRGQDMSGAGDALASLQNIANKMFDHFSAADREGLGSAFPASKEYNPDPFLSVKPPLSQLPANALKVEQPLLKQELARLGLRFAIGATTGGIIAPKILGNQITTSEGVMLGGIAGVFGPMIAKKMLSENFAEDVAKAFKGTGGNPIKAWANVMGGKSLRDWGMEGRYGFTAETSGIAKLVRFAEKEMNVNYDPKQRALIENQKGFGTEINAVVNDAMNKVRFYSPSPEMYDAVEKYFTGKMSKDDFQKLLTTPELQTYGNFITTIREGTTTLTQGYAQGIKDGAFKNYLIDTAETYIGRFYSAYKEGKFNEAAFDKAKADFMQSFPEYSDAAATAILREHQRDIIANRGLFGGKTGVKIDTSTQFRRLATEEEIEAQQVVVGGLEHDPYGVDYQKEKMKLDWMESHKITDGWRDWLGEYKNPVQRMIFTFQKVHPSAVSAKIFDALDNANNVNSHGLKFAYTAIEIEQTRGLLEHAASKEQQGSPEFARLQTQLKELSGYGPLSAGAKYGKLAEKWVDRFTRDELATDDDTTFKWMQNPFMRGMAQFNQMIKVNRTALNPLTVIRDYVQMPLFALMAKTKAGDIADAFKEIHFTKGDDYRLLLRKHMIGADFVTSELLKGPGSIVSGFMDSDIATKAGKMAMDKIFQLHQQPDMLLRAGSFFSAQRRFAQAAMEDRKFASLQDAMKDEGVIDKAARFTDRFTQNYGAVPRIVKAGRQLPFVNLFISYTSEITRIVKNLAQDAIHPDASDVSIGRMHALTTLGAMAAIPAIMIKGAEANLSPKDQQDWEKFKALSPADMRTRFRIPISRDAQGRFHYFDITNLLPADSLSEMVRAIGNGDLKAAAAVNPIVNLQNTPLLNMVSEQVTGTDVGTGQKIMGFGRAKEILKEIIPPWIPPGYEGTRLVRAFSENADGTRGLENIKSGVQYTPGDIIANYMTAMKFGNAKLETIQRQAISEAQEKMGVQQQLLKDVILMNVPQSEKDRAQANYLQAVQEIMLQLHSRMGTPTPPI